MSRNLHIPKIVSHNFSRYCVEVSYIGTKYSGWVSNENCNPPSVSEIITKSIHKFSSGNYENFKGSSRTDRGVHALQNTFQVDLLNNKNSNNENYLQSIKNGINFHFNDFHNDNINIINVQKVSDIFDCRADVKSRTYFYRLLIPKQSNNSIKHKNINNNIFYNNLVWELNKSLNIDEMTLACQYFLGEKDFNSFRSKECQSKSSFRNIHSINILC